MTRFKKNTPFRVVEEHAVAEASDILSDRTGGLTARRKNGRRNPFTKPVREVRVGTETGKTPRLFSTDPKATAREISDLYKRCRAIELFFKWIKQTLEIKHFLGNSKNAVRIQIAVALIACLLLRLARQTQSTIASPLAFARLVRQNLIHRKRIDRLLEPDTSDPRPNKQWAFI